MMKLKDRVKKLKKDIPAVFIAMRKKETPIAAKILAGLTVGYALSPIDLIPDFIPVLGYLDDIILLPVLVFLTVKLIPKNLFKLCQQEAEGLWQKGKPKKWYYAIPFVLTWAFMIFFIIKAITR